MNYLSDILYKIDSKEKVRIFQVEVDGDRYRMISGLIDGKRTESKWTTCTAKNIGKLNSTTPEVQAGLEAEARITKKLAEHYYKTIEEARETPVAFFKVMLATEIDKVKPKPELPYLLDPKLDGMRLVEHNLYSLSRRGKPVSAAKWIHEELEDFLFNNPTITLDGEIYNHEYREDFNTLMSIARRDKMNEKQAAIAESKLQYHIYDMFDSNNPDMTAIERKEWLLEQTIYSDRIKQVDYTIVYDEDELNEVKGKHLTDGYEGSIVRTLNSKYENKRSKNLLKIKEFLTEEYTITNIHPGLGNRSDIAGSVEIRIDRVTVKCGIRGSWEYSRDLLNTRSDLIGKVATVRHFGKTPDGSLRFPICIDIDRPD